MAKKQNLPSAGNRHGATGHSGIEVEMDMKRFFVDRKELTKLIGKEVAWALSRGIRKIRDHARRSIPKAYEKRRKAREGAYKRELEGKLPTKAQRRNMDIRTSTPGSPPNAQNPSNSRSIRNIQYGIIPWNLEGIVGPVLLRVPSQTNSVILGAKTVPQLLEEGGSAIFTELRVGKRWTTIYDPKKKHNPKRYRKRMARYAPRPFMKPALDKAVRMGQLIEEFEGSLLPTRLPVKAEK